MKKPILFLLVTILGICTLNAAIWRVNSMPDNHADFTILSEAINAASDGDIIYIEGAGIEYDEQTITLTKSITFYGSGYYLGENENTQASLLPTELGMSIEIDAGAEGSRFYGIKFQGFHVYVGTSDITFERCYFYTEMRLHSSEQAISNFMMKQCIMHGDLWIWTMYYNSSNLTFVNNIFFDGLTLGSELANSIVRNNIFVGHYSVLNTVNAVIQNNIADGGIPCNASDNNLVENNLIGTGEMPETGTNNIGGIDLADLFVDYPDGANTSPDAMYMLKEGSQALGYGIGGIDCGIFDGPFPYVLSGLPSIPRIYEANISSSGTSQGLRVSIKAKSQH